VTGEIDRSIKRRMYRRMNGRMKGRLKGNRHKCENRKGEESENRGCIYEQEVLNKKERSEVK
jgi:hypothetical protein